MSLPANEVSRFCSRAELDAFLNAAPLGTYADGRVKLIVCRPAVDERQIISSCQLDPLEGMLGDGWKARVLEAQHDPGEQSYAQITVMNARVVQRIAGEISRWPLAGDQFFVDADLSIERLPAGSLVAIGDCVLEVSTQPHNGCGKFAKRYGPDALQWVNSPQGKALRLRGFNARIVQGGVVRQGDEFRKL